MCVCVGAGVRHSIGGADYGSVRAGAFMGLRIMTQLQADRGPEPLGQLYMLCFFCSLLKGSFPLLCNPFMMCFLQCHVLKVSKILKQSFNRGFTKIYILVLSSCIWQGTTQT